jgi:hypothetical protein
MSSTTDSTLQAEVDRLRLELKTIRAQTQDVASGQITVGNYLLTRLEQLGVTVRLLSLFACIDTTFQLLCNRKCLAYRETSTWAFW